MKKPLVGAHVKRLLRALQRFLRPSGRTRSPECEPMVPTSDREEEMYQRRSAFGCLFGEFARPNSGHLLRRKARGSRAECLDVKRGKMAFGINESGARSGVSPQRLSVEDVLSDIDQPPPGGASSPLERCVRLGFGHALSFDQSPLGHFNRSPLGQ